MGIVSCTHCLFNWYFFRLYPFYLVHLRPGKQRILVYWAVPVEVRPLPLASVYNHVKRSLAESRLPIFRYFMIFFFYLATEKFPGTNLDLLVFKYGLLCYLLPVWHRVLKVRLLNKSFWLLWSSCESYWTTTYGADALHLKVAVQK
jgi:hypothetical protein